jgi:hypothetical protein
MNKKPICDNPINGSMETLSGYRLCCNPKHSEESDYAFSGPVWHPIADWPAKPQPAPKLKPYEPPTGHIDRKMLKGFRMNRGRH